MVSYCAVSNISNILSKVNCSYFGEYKFIMMNVLNIRFCTLHNVGALFLLGKSPIKEASMQRGVQLFPISHLFHLWNVGLYFILTAIN